MLAPQAMALRPRREVAVSACDRHRFDQPGQSGSGGQRRSCRQHKRSVRISTGQHQQLRAPPAGRHVRLWRHAGQLPRAGQDLRQLTTVGGPDILVWQEVSRPDILVWRKVTRPDVSVWLKKASRNACPPVCPYDSLSRDHSASSSATGAGEGLICSIIHRSRSLSICGINSSPQGYCRSVTDRPAA